MDRRSALKIGAGALAGLLLPGCSRGARVQPVLAGSPGAPAPVRVARERLIRTVAGLRPYRPSGFRVEVERLGDKLVIHNYGHGGAGVTLSWGTAALAAEHASAGPYREAAVLGCGAVGLATARLLQDRGFKVRIRAHRLPPDTTSNLAGALWSPFTVAARVEPGTPFHGEFVGASRFAHRRFQTMVGAHYGVRWMPLYLFGPAAVAGPARMWPHLEDLFPAVRLEAGSGPFPGVEAWVTHAMLIEPARYLAAVLSDFRLAGGELVVQELADRSAVMALPEPLIVNCTGLGARELFGDLELVPSRGQVAFLLPQPELDHMYLAGRAHMFPRSDGVFLGGTHEVGEWSTDPEPAAIDAILRAHAELAVTLG